MTPLVLGSIVLGGVVLCLTLWTHFLVASLRGSLALLNWRMKSRITARQPRAAVQRTRGGFTIRDLHINLPVLLNQPPALHLPIIHIAELSYKAPLQLKVSGLTVQVHLQRVPKATRARPRWTGVENKKLRAFESGLWGRTEAPGKRRLVQMAWLAWLVARLFVWVPSWSQCLAWGVRGVTALIMARLRVELKDVTVIHVQEGEPGPYALQTPPACRDAIALTVRNAMLKPPSKASARQVRPAAAPAADSAAATAAASAAATPREVPAMSSAPPATTAQNGTGTLLGSLRSSPTVITNTAGAGVTAANGQPQSPRVASPGPRPPPSPTGAGVRQRGASHGVFFVHGFDSLDEDARLAIAALPADADVSTADALAMARGVCRTHVVVAGVNLMVLTKSLIAEREAAAAAEAAQDARRWATPARVRVSGARRDPYFAARNRRAADRSQAPPPRAATPAPADTPSPTQTPALVSLSEDAWDARYTLVQQWGAEIDITLRPRPVTPCTTGTSTNTATGTALSAPGGLPYALTLSFLSAAAVNTTDSLGADANNSTATPQPPDAAAAGAAGGAAASGLFFHTDIRLKACVPQLSPQPLLVVLRVVDRVLGLFKYAQCWWRRPAVSVRQSPVAWWQHACKCVLTECRRRYPIRSFKDVLATQSEYMLLYCALNYNKTTNRQYPPFYKDLRVNNLRLRAQALLEFYGKAYVRHQLQLLENKLTLGQAMVYRSMVALRYSKFFVRHPDSYQRTVLVLDMLAIFAHALPFVKSSGDTAKKKNGGFTLTVSCPRFGVQFITPTQPQDMHQQPPATAPTTAPTTQAPLAVVFVGLEGLDVQIADFKRIDVKIVRVQLTTSHVHQGLTDGLLSPSALHASLTDTTNNPTNNSTTNATANEATTTDTSSLISIPAPLAHIEAFGPKMDLSNAKTAQPSAGAQLPAALVSQRGAAPAAAAPPPGGAASASYPSVSTLNLNGVDPVQEASVAKYFAVMKVSLAPVELSVTAHRRDTPLLTYVRSFLQVLSDARGAGLCSSGPLLSGERSSSLVRIVRDSYKDKKPVPSAMAAFAPAIQLDCPQILLRYELAPSATNSITVQNVNLEGTSVHVCLALSAIHLQLRYTSTVYGCLCQQTKLHGSLQSAFQIHPVSNASDQRNDLKGQYMRLWLRTSDMDQLYRGGAVPLTSDSGARPSVMHSWQRASRLSRSMAGAALRPTNRPERTRTNTFPFFPLFMVQHVMGVAVRLVPFEPTILGQTTAHVSVNTFGALAWFSPWQAELVAALIRSLIQDPFTQLRKKKPSQPPQSAANTQPQSASAQDTAQTPRPADTAPPHTAAPQSPATPRVATPAARRAQRTSLSRVSFLLDVPLLTVMCYARRSTVVAMDTKDPAPPLKPARWVLNALSDRNRTGGTPDPSVAFGEQMSPLLSLHVIELSTGARLAGGEVHVRTNVGSVMVNNHQIQVRQMRVWSDNSSLPYTNTVNESEPSLHGCMLGPLENRAQSGLAFVRNRRRVMHAINLAEPTHKRGQQVLLQMWRRPLEVYLIMKATDFAFFLLTRPTSAVPAHHNSAWRWYCSLLKQGSESTNDDAEPFDTRDPLTDMLMDLKSINQASLELWETGKVSPPQLHRRHQSGPGGPSLIGSLSFTGGLQRNSVGPMNNTPMTSSFSRVVRRFLDPSRHAATPDSDASTPPLRPAHSPVTQQTPASPAVIEEQLSFCKVYSQTRAGARTPFQDPNIKLSFTSRLSQRPVTLRPTSNPNLGTGSSPSNGQTDVSDRHNTLTVNVGYMNASIAMYATLQIIRLVQAAGKALRGDRPARPRPPAPPRPPPPARRSAASNTFSLEVVMVGAKAKIVVEEGPGGRKENAATHLTSIVLLETQCSARHVMATDTQPDGLRLTLAIHHACVRDLQAAIEHSRVIAFQTPEQTARMQRSKLSATAGGAAAAAAATAAPRSPSPTQGGLSPPLTSQTKPVVQLMCMFPSTRGSPPAIVVTLNSPRVMLQLRYIMSVVHAVQILFLKPKPVQPQTQGGAPPPPLVLPPPLPPPPPLTHTPGPVIILQASDLELVMPGGCQYRKGPIKRAQAKEGLVCTAKELQLVMPGFFECAMDESVPTSLDAALDFLTRNQQITVDDWLTDDSDVAHYMVRSEQLLRQHFACSQRPAPQKDGRGQADGGQPGSPGPAGQLQRQLKRNQQTSRWARLQQVTEETLVKPIKNLMDQAARMALTTNKNESGAVVMRLDLDQDEKEDWRPQEQMQTHTVDTHTAPPLSTVGGGGVSDVGNPADLAAAGTGAGGAAVTAGGTVAVDAGAAAAGAAVSEAETAAAAGVGACVGGTDAASQGYAAYSPRAGSYTRPDPYLKPLLLISVEELSGYSCTVEAGEVSEAMIVQSINGIHSEDPDVLVEAQRVRKAMANYQIRNRSKLLHEATLHGLFMLNRRLRSMQLHFSVLNTMVAVLGPRHYQDILRMAIDNMAAGTHTYFQQVTTVGVHRVFNTKRSDQPAFAPNPKEIPFFSLTFDWVQIQASLQNDPAWWDPELVTPLPSTRPDATTPTNTTPDSTASSTNTPTHVDGTFQSMRNSAHKRVPAPPRRPGRAAEPFLQGSLNQAGFSLMMMRGTGNMHIAFQSADVRVADVRGRRKTHRSSGGTQNAGPQASQPSFSAQSGQSQLQPTQSQPPLPQAGGSGAYASFSSSPDKSEEWLKKQMRAASNQSVFQRPQSAFHLGPTHSGDADRSDAGGVSGVQGGGRGDHDNAVSDDEHDTGHNYEAIITPSAADPQDPEVTLIHCNTRLLHSESAHLRDTNMNRATSFQHMPYSPDDDAAFKLLFSMLADGTMACEVEFDRTLVAWPYLTEMSLVNAIVSIFVSTWCQGPGPPDPPVVRIWPWFYFNLVIRNSQALIPVLSAHIPKDIAPKPQLNWPSLHTLFTALLNETRAQATGPRRFSSYTSTSEGYPPRLEDTGLVLTMSAFRFGYFFGGDGDSVMQVDLRNAAGFVRLQGACVTNFLLPIKTLALSWLNNCPRFEEHQLLEERRRNLQLARRVRQRMTRYARAHIAARGDAACALARPATAPSETPTDAQKRGGSAATVKQPPKPWEQLLALAMERAANLLRDQDIKMSQDSDDKVGPQGKPIDRSTWRSTLRLELEACTVRAAFSHVPLWQLLSSDLALLSAHMTPGKGPGMFPLARHMLTRERAAEILSRPPNLLQTLWYFRRRIQKYEIQLKRVSAIVCNDKPTSFGAPDMLQACIDKMNAIQVMDYMFFGHQPQQTGHIEVVFSVNYLNNSTSNWDTLLEPWPMVLLLSNPVNKIFKDNRTTYVAVNSSESLRVLFHPAALLTIGDTLALVRAMSKPVETRLPPALYSASRSDSFDPVLRASFLMPPGQALNEPTRPHEDVPPVEEQMGLTIPITKRVPQRYLILNQTGMALWYWRPLPDGSNRVVDAHKLLPSRTAKELKVQPRHKQCTMVGPDGVTITQIRAAVINMKFEGNWMPLTDVATDVVGKYCYYLDMPLEKRRVPLLVDVTLMGRNKIIKLHSALFVENSTTLDLSFRLLLPSPQLAQQVLRRPQEQNMNSFEIRLPPLQPGQGRYLPVVACLDGVLLLEPQGCRPTEHDVIRLSPNVSAMPEQEGYICCMLAHSDGSTQHKVLRFASKVKVKSRIDWRQGSHHEMEVWYPGKFVKANQPLEATIKIKPTVVLTNSLPYLMRAYVVAVQEHIDVPLERASTANATAPTAATPTAATAAAAAPATAMDDSPQAVLLDAFTRATAPVTAAVTAAAAPVTAAAAPVTAAAAAAANVVMTAAVGSPDRASAQFHQPAGSAPHSPTHDTRPSPFVLVRGIPFDAPEPPAILPHTPAAYEEKERLATLSAFKRLAEKLHKRNLGRRALMAPSWEVKRTIALILRNELRWASPQIKRVNDLLFRTEGDKDMAYWERVSWSEVRRTVSWLLANLTVTDITPGDSVSFYVQLTEMVYVSLRLPRLAMQSARPCPLNELVVTQGTTDESTEVPESLRMRAMDTTYTEMNGMWDKSVTMLEQELETKAKKEREKRTQEALRQVFDLSSQGIPAAGYATAQPTGAAQPLFGLLPFWNRAAPEPAARAAADQRLVAVELRVEPDDRPVYDTDEPTNQAPAVSLPSEGGAVFGLPDAVSHRFASVANMSSNMSRRPGSQGNLPPQGAAQIPPAVRFSSISDMTNHQGPTAQPRERVRVIIWVRPDPPPAPPSRPDAPSAPMLPSAIRTGFKRRSHIGRLWFSDASVPEEKSGAATPYEAPASPHASAAPGAHAPLVHMQLSVAPDADQADRPVRVILTPTTTESGAGPGPGPRRGASSVLKRVLKSISLIPSPSHSPREPSVSAGGLTTAHKQTSVALAPMTSAAPASSALPPALQPAAAGLPPHMSGWQDNPAFSSGVNTSTDSTSRTAMLPVRVPAPTATSPMATHSPRAGFLSNVVFALSPRRASVAETTPTRSPGGVGGGTIGHGEGAANTPFELQPSPVPAATTAPTPTPFAGAGLAPPPWAAPAGDAGAAAKVSDGGSIASVNVPMPSEVARKLSDDRAAAMGSPAAAAAPVGSVPTTPAPVAPGPRQQASADGSPDVGAIGPSVSGGGGAGDMPSPAGASHTTRSTPDSANTAIVHSNASPGFFATAHEEASDSPLPSQRGPAVAAAAAQRGPAVAAAAAVPPAQPPMLLPELSLRRASAPGAAPRAVTPDAATPVSATASRTSPLGGAATPDASGASARPGPLTRLLTAAARGLGAVSVKRYHDAASDAAGESLSPTGTAASHPTSLPEQLGEHSRADMPRASGHRGLRVQSETASIASDDEGRLTPGGAKRRRSLPDVTDALKKAVVPLETATHIGDKLQTTTTMLGEGLKVTSQKMATNIKSTGAKVQEGIIQTGTKVGEGIKQTGAKMGEGILQTGAKVGEGIVDTGVKVVETGVETAGQGARYLQLGMTRLVAKGGVRGGDTEWATLPFVNDGETLEELSQEGVLRPHMLFLGLDRSRSSARTCRVGVFAHFWIDNRTGLDLVFRDLDVPYSCYALAPLLLYHQVRAPGRRQDRLQILRSNTNNTTHHGNGSHLPPSEHSHDTQPDTQGPFSRYSAFRTMSVTAGGEAADTVAPLQPNHLSTRGSLIAADGMMVALLNEQKGASFKILDKTAESDWCHTFKIDTAGQKLDISLKGKLVKLTSDVKRMASLVNDDRSQSGRMKSLQRTSNGDLHTQASLTPHPDEAIEASSRNMRVVSAAFASLESKAPQQIQRLYNLAVEMWPAPDDSVFSRTKVLTIKNKYIMLNDTGLTIEFKQQGTPDPVPGQVYGVTQRFAGNLPTGARAAIHWDNGFLKQQLVIRPADGAWCWSGSFELKEKEEYFGLRIRPMIKGRPNKIIPVNITVGSAGQVLVTLKSEKSVPPYLIVNRCKEVVIRLRQQGRLRTTAPQSWSWDRWDEVSPGQSEAFAWDKPNEEHKVQVVAYATNFNIDDQEDNEGDMCSVVDLDDLKGRIKPLDVHQDVIRDPTRQDDDSDIGTRVNASTRAHSNYPYRPDSNSVGMTEAQRMQRLARELMHSYARKVHVSIYAEGPTRILCFSEDKINAASSDDEDSLPNLEVRLQQIKTKMTEVESELGKTVGMMERGMTSAEQLLAAGSEYMQANARQAQQQQTQQQGMPAPASTTSLAMAAAAQVAAAAKLTSSAAVTPAAAHSTRSSPVLQRPASLRVPASAFAGASVSTAAARAHSAALALPDSMRPAASSLASTTTTTASSLPATAVSFALPPVEEITPATDDKPPTTAPTTQPSDALGPLRPLPKIPSISALSTKSYQAASLALRPGLTPTNLPYASVAQQGVSLMAYPVGVVSAIGGDLSIRITSVTGLPRRMTNTHAYAEVSATMHDNQTSPIVPIGVDGTLNVDYTCTFRGVAASDELRIEFWTLSIGYPSSESAGPNASALRNARRVFLGCVEIPLQDTLTGSNGQPRTLDDISSRPLKRQTGTQLVRGRVQYAVSWQFTSEGLLVREVQQLELMLAKKVEIVARMKPVPCTEAMNWLQLPDPPQENRLFGGNNVDTDTDQAAPLNATVTRVVTGGPSHLVETEAGVMSALNAQQISEIYYVNLDVSVQEVTGVRLASDWRRDVLKRIAGSGMGWQQGADAVETRGVPHVCVTVSCAGVEHSILAEEPNLEPRFKQENFSYNNIALTNLVSIKVWDQRSRLVGKGRALLGEAVLCVGSVPSVSPVYVWVPLWEPRQQWVRRWRRDVAQARRHGDPPPPFSPYPPEGLDTCIQVFLRLQISKPATRGVKLGLTLDLASVGLCAKTSVYELLNFTLQNLRMSMLQTTRDLQLALAVNNFQLDNQLLETLRPVVLSPHNMPSITGQQPVRFNHQKLLDMINSAVDKPLLSVQMVRSYATEVQGSYTRRHAAAAAAGAAAGLATGAEVDDLAAYMPGSPASPGPSSARAAQAAAQQKMSLGEGGAEEKPVTIISFKQLEFDLGPLDLMTDQKFLEAVYMYVQTLPMADMRQDEQWQRAMDSEMQGFPYQMSVNAIGDANPGTAPTAAPSAARLPPAAQRVGSAFIAHGASGGGGGSFGGFGGLGVIAYPSLSWLSDKEDHELRMMLEQSSSWFFIETLAIGALSVNITLAITSNFETGAARKKKEQRTVLRGVITRLAGSTGFQLIDATDAPVNLAGKIWTSLLVNRVGLVSLLVRHYSWLAMAEARKLLGSAGPAIASVPLNVLWAGINIAELGRDLAMKRIDATAAPLKVGYVLFTASGQMIRFVSQGLGWVLSVLPVARDDWLSDTETLRRFTRRPQNVLDALALAQKDISVSIVSALAGVILDPYEGARASSTPGWAVLGFLAGVTKAVIGVPLRPTAGIIHGLSDLFQGMGLACLGKQGIQGKLLRRVMAPGTPMLSGLEGVVEGGAASGEAGRDAERCAMQMRTQLLSAWQAALPYVAPELDGDIVMDVIAARRSRVVLLTNKHMAYLKAMHHPAGPHAGTTTYRLKWYLRNDLVDNVRGVERSFRISIKYRKVLRGLMLELPLHHGMRTKDAETHQNLIYRLNRHIRDDHEGTLQPGVSAPPERDDDLDLTIAVPPANIVHRLG